MTEDVLNRHLKAFGVGIDEIMKDFIEESVIITNEATYRGLDEIRDFFLGLLESFTPDVWDNFELLKSEVEGNVAYIAWSAPPLTDLATDTFLVRDDHIAVQTFTKS